MTNYVYHLYGNDEIFFIEACYSIGTLIKKLDAKHSRIIVFTDSPARFQSLPVVCESIAGKIDEMKGPHGFGYRVKLGCLLKCAEAYPGNLIYLDCDTIVRGPIEEMAAAVDHGVAWMFREERLIGRFSQFDGFQTNLHENLKYRYGPKSRMFNAGIIGLHHDDVKIINTALAICDALLEQGRRNHVCEQFAVSEALRISGLKILEARPFVAHYYRTSAKRYMHETLLRLSAEQKELWNLGRAIPYSYPRVQWHKLKRKIFK